MADIHSLELDFAKNPTLDVCIPLVEAYIANKRFMEAMVVCKKGIKGAPTDPRGRVMLARVYVEQGKLPKAQQELAKVMQDFPGNAMGLELQGRVAMNAGDQQNAVAFLQQALATDPSLVNARQWLGQMGVAAPAAAPQAMPQQPMAQPGMPAAQPGMPPAQPAMPQQAMPQPGMPQQPPPQMPAPQPGMPGMAPQAQPAMPQAQPPGPAPGMPGPAPGMPPGMPQAAPAGQPPPGMNLPAHNPGVAAPVPGAGAPSTPWGNGAPGGTTGPETPPAGVDEAHLEHVSDFFAPDTLGFQTEASNIETAGPGRLTILGFVPKSTGSIKTTIAVALTVFAVAAAIITWQVISGQNKRKIAEFYRDMLEAIEEDKYFRYQDALDLGNRIFEIDDDEPDALSALAYAYSVLALEHKEPDALAKAKQYYDRAMDEVDKENEHVAAAGALIAYQEKRYQEGIDLLQGLKDKGAVSTLLEMEMYRIQNAMEPEGETAKKQFSRLARGITSEARAFNYVGWAYFDKEDYPRADSSFTSAIQNSKAHPQASLGLALVDLFRQIGLKERQKEVEEKIKKVFALPKEELSQPVLALGYLTRSQLRNWQCKDKEELEDFNKAIKLDDDAMFHYLRGKMSLSVNDYKKAVESLKKAAAKDPNSVKTLKVLAKSQIESKDFKGAKASLDRVDSLAQNDGEAILLRGHMLLASRKNKEAKEEFKKVDKKDHGVANLVRATIGISQAMRADRQKCEGFMEKFLGNAPRGVTQPLQAELWAELGQCWEAARNKSKAMECYTIAAEQFRYYDMTHYYVAKLNNGKGAEAKTSCKTYMTLSPRGKYVDFCARASGEAPLCK